MIEKDFLQIIYCLLFQVMSALNSDISETCAKGKLIERVGQPKIAY